MESIILPNNEIYQINIQEYETAKEVLKQICEDHYKIDTDHNPHFKVLAISITIKTLSDGNEINKETCKFQLQLADDNKLSDVKKNSQTFFSGYNPIFELTRNGYYSIEKEKEISNITLLEILFLFARNNVHKNIYPFDTKERIELDKIEFLIKEKEETVSEESQDLKRREKFWEIVNATTKDFTYQNVIRKTQKKIQMRLYAKNVIKKLNQNKNHDLLNLYKNYLEKCHQIACYGGFFFEGQMERSIVEFLIHQKYYDKQVIISINTNGLHIINIECPKILFSIPLDKLDYGIQTPKIKDCLQSLYVKTGNTKIKTIYTRQALFIDQTLSFIKV